MLPGSVDGIIYYITPRLDRLFDPQVSNVHPEIQWRTSHWAGWTLHLFDETLVIVSLLSRSCQTISSGRGGGSQTVGCLSPEKPSIWHFSQRFFLFTSDKLLPIRNEMLDRGYMQNKTFANHLQKMFYEMDRASSQSLLCYGVSAQHDVILTWVKETLWLAAMTLAHEYLATSTRPLKCFVRFLQRLKHF